MAYQRSFKGKIIVTADMIRQMLSLPKECEVTGFTYDSDRELLTVGYRSNTLIDDVTYRVEEGQEIPTVDYNRVLRKSAEAKGTPNYNNEKREVDNA